MLFQRVTAAKPVQNFSAEDCHLLLGEICLCEHVLYFNETGVKFLVLVPNMLPDGQLVADSRCREQCGRKELTLLSGSPFLMDGQKSEQLFDGLVARSLQRVHQTFYPLLRGRYDVGVGNNPESVWSQD